ncbi:MAG: molybdate ABC transporter substrate-binding protein, partial [Eggerthellaceae bacterium]|nr:molybdate ABC transporter substrate-binding protein [Eggerthellaceae bacterium]
MKKITRRAFTIIATLSMVSALGMFGCTNEDVPDSDKQETVELQVFAANSLSKAMEEVQELYMETHKGVTFSDTQYLSSGDLNAQLQAGAYADLLISASSGKMNDAVEAGLVDESTRFNMFANDLVMAVSKDSPIQTLTLEDVATGSYTAAIGDDSVPAGNYANQALSTVGCFIDPDGKVGAESAGKANST